tara:strand:- start:81 stop:533 length:453 start_codon:yes stop_codon:yes gene_type:complete
MNTFRDQSIMFIVMVIIGIAFNPMNMLAYKFDHLYISTTLFYGGIMMASNMVWGHQIVHYLQMGHFDLQIFVFGLLLSIFTTKVLLRKQLNVDVNQWLRRMIPHHSTALTTTKKLISSGKIKENSKLYRLAKDIIYNQDREILVMKSYLK